MFGTNGPDTFDRSGLTRWACAKAVGMPHYTVSQFNAFPHVGLNELQPGDLVFFNIDLGRMGCISGTATSFRRHARASSSRSLRSVVATSSARCDRDDSMTTAGRTPRHSKQP